MPEMLYPDAIITQAGFSGTVTDIQNDMNNIDNTWLVGPNNGAEQTLRVSFPTPSGTLDTGTDVQKMRVLVRKSSAGGSTPTVDIEIYDGATLLGSGTGASVTSDTGMGLQVSFTAPADGSNIEVRIYSPSSGGKPADRRDVGVGGVEWEATTVTPEQFEENFALRSEGALATNIGWTKLWNTGSTDSIVLVDTPSGKALRHEPTASNRKAIAWTAPGNATDIDYRMKFRVAPGSNIPTDSTGDYYRAMIAISGNAGAENVHMVELSVETDRKIVESRTYNNSTLTNEGHINFDWKEGQWYWIRMRREGSTIMWKFWLHMVEDEPTTWNTFAAASTLPAGYVGYGSFTARGIYDIDYVSAGTYGAESPKPPPEVEDPNKFAAVSMTAQSGVIIYVPPVPNLIDFSGYPDGNIASTNGWTEIWNTNAGHFSLPSIEHIGGRYIYEIASTGARRCWAYTAAGIATNIDVRLRYRQSRPVGDDVRVYARAGGAAGSETGVFLEISNTRGLVIRVYDAGSLFDIVNASFTPRGMKWYNVRFRVNGDIAMAKIWERIEPDEWTISATLPAVSFVDGYFGLGFYSPLEAEYDVLSYGLNGDEAPILPPGTPYRELPALQRHPLPPEGLTATPASGAIVLDWSPVEGADGYRIIRDGIIIATTPNTTYRDTTTGTHTYQVRAYRSII